MKRKTYEISMGGNSMLAHHIHGFAHYFYVPPPQNFYKGDCGVFKDAINTAVMEDLQANKEGIVEGIVALDYVMRESTYGFLNNGKTPFLKITIAIARLIAQCTRILEESLICLGYPTHIQSYEWDVDFEIRDSHLKQPPPSHFSPKVKFLVAAGLTPRTLRAPLA